MILKRSNGFSCVDDEFVIMFVDNVCDEFVVIGIVVMEEKCFGVYDVVL